MYSGVKEAERQDERNDMTKRERKWFKDLVKVRYTPEQYERIAEKMERDLTAEESDEVYESIYLLKRKAVMS